MERRGWAVPKILLIVAAISISIVWPGPSLLHAQRVRPRPLAPGTVPAAGESADDSVGTGNFAAPDRTILQALKRAEKVLKEHRYGEALEGLTQVIRNKEDYLFPPDRKGPLHKGLKAEAEQLLGRMPREGLDLYEARSGAEARDKLNRAAAKGDDAALSEVSAQFFHTHAGYEATYLLALYQMDHGAPLAGALTLKRLHEAGAAAETFEPGLSLTQAACYYQAGMPRECQQVLVDLKRRLGKPALQLAGREAPWFGQESDAPAWLAKLTGLQPMAAATETDRWAMFRGDPSRNASTVGGAPLLSLRWRVPVTDNPLLEKVLHEQEGFYREHSIAVFSGLHPLVVGDVVLMRTTSNVLAVDFHTGKRLWPTRTEEEESANPSPNVFNRRLWMRGNMGQPAQYGQRIWDDATYGTLSSDGSRVFVIEGLPLGVTGPYGGGFMFGGGGGNDPSSRGITNKLVAYDIFGDGKPGDGGKVVWELGGPEDLKQSDTFFLGPPLPLRGQLYVMAEINGEIRLLALDGATGKELWSQQLALVESNITQDPVRRLAGVSPSYGDGVLICPTGSGNVVAVDLATRSFRWGYVYSHLEEPAAGQPFMGRRMRGNPFQNGFNNLNGPVPRWLDGTAIIANGRVLLTPAEADSLYCLNLADGTAAWAPQPRVVSGEHGERVEHYYLGCVHKGVVLLVGRNAIDAIRLEDGGKAWDTINMPLGAGVCGHGCYAGGQYFVPLSSGEVMTVDVESGKVLATVKSRRSAEPGNLICYRGRVISQGLDGLEVYYQADAARDDAARRLAANADDVEGLTLRGEILMDAGKPAEAVADFRRAYSLGQKSDARGRTRELLRDALLAGLRDDFPANRSMAGEVEPLLDDPGQRATYLRCMASGFHRAGEWQRAVEQYLKLVDLAAEAKLPLETVDRSHLVRRDCWVEARLGVLRREGGAAAAAQIDRLLEPRLEEAKKVAGLDGLNRFLRFFGNQPQAAAARAELLQRLTQKGQILQAEMLMAAAAPAFTGDTGTDRKAQAALLADMADLNFRAGRVSDAAACFRQLRQQFADVPCHAGMTSSQWLAVFPNGDALRREVEQKAPAWPVGEVEASPPEVNENPIMNRGFRFERPLGGPSGPFFADYILSFENGQQEAKLRDGLGHLQTPPVRLVDANRVNGGFFVDPNSTVARCCGHLLVMSTRTRICALDPWQASGNTPSPAGRVPPDGKGAAGGEGIPWFQDLSGATAENGGILNFVDYNEMRANPFGPVNARYVCFQRKRSIVAVDPLSGDPLWVRQDIPHGSEVFGDEQYLFVLPPNSDEASVYRAIDGQLLGKRKVPRPKPDENPFSDASGRGGNLTLSNFGLGNRFVLTWGQGSDSNGRVLNLFDPWEQKAVWPSRNFASGAHLSVVGSEAVGVLEPGGHFVLVALADGRTIADVQLDLRRPDVPHFSVTDLVVTRMGDQYIVLANDNRLNGNQDQGMQPPPGMPCYLVRRARIYALDLQGKLAWRAPVDIDHQEFLLDQPGRLPVLLFAVFRYDHRVGQQTWRTSLVAVDRRNGRIVYDKDSRGPMRGMGVDISGDPAKKTVRIATNNEVVHLTFTDKPIRATVRHSTGILKPRGKLGEALLDAVEGATPLIPK